MSIHPLASLTESLVQNWAKVVTLLPPGGSPHGYELNADQMTSLGQADALVVVGMGLDDWAVRAAEQAGRKDLRVYRMAELIHGAQGLPPAMRPSGPDQEAGPRDVPAGQGSPEDAHDDLHDDEHARGDDDAHHHRGPNPHLWLDPALTFAFVTNLSTELEGLFPDKLASLHARTLLLRKDLFSLDQELRQRLAGVRRKEMVTFHNAFDLMADRYGLRVVAHLTDVDLAPGGEVTPDRLVEAIDAVKRYDLKVIYAEPQFPDEAMGAITRQTGAAVLTLDPQGNPNVEGRRTYLQMMKSNGLTLAEGQSR